MNSCDYYQELISRLVDGEVSHDEYEALMAHMKSCSSCNAMYAVFHDLSDILSEKPETLPEGLHENIMAGVRRSDIIRKNRRMRKIGMRTALTAAACLVLVLFAATGFNPARRAEDASIRSPEYAEQLPAAPTAGSAGTADLYAAPAETVPPAGYAAPTPVILPTPAPTAYAVPEAPDAYLAGDSAEIRTIAPQPQQDVVFYTPEPAWTAAPAQTAPAVVWTAAPAAPAQEQTAAVPEQIQAAAAPTPVQESAAAAVNSSEPAAEPAAAEDGGAPLLRAAPAKAPDAADAESAATDGNQADPTETAANGTQAEAPAENAGASAKSNAVMPENVEAATQTPLLRNAGPLFIPNAVEEAVAEDEGTDGHSDAAGDENADDADFSVYAELFGYLDGVNGDLAEGASPAGIRPEEQDARIRGKETREKLFALLGSREENLPEAQLTRIVHVTLVPEDEYGSEEKLDLLIYGDFVFYRLNRAGMEDRNFQAGCSLRELEAFLQASAAADVTPSPTPTVDPFAAEEAESGGADDGDV